MRVVLAILLAVLTSGVRAQNITECDAARAREALPAHDGWAGSGAGTTGGSLATPNDVFVARNREELLASLSGTAPKIVFITGRIDLNDGMTTVLGRLRRDDASARGWKYVLVSHNTKMGAAKGCILLAEQLLKAGHITAK